MFNSRVKIKIIAIITCVVFLAFLFVAILPFSAKIKKNSRGLIEKKSELALKQYNINEAEKFQSRESELNEDLTKIREAFIDISSPVIFLEYLDDLASKNNLLINIVPYNTKIDSNDIWTSSGFKIDIGGNAEDCLKFLSALEHSKWIFEILNFSMKEIGEKNSFFKEFEELKQGDAFASFVIKAYSGEFISKK